MRRSALALPALVLALAAQAASGEKIGAVDTAFQWIGRDHDILVEAYDDPAVQGVTGNVQAFPRVPTLDEALAWAKNAAGI